MREPEAETQLNPGERRGNTVQLEGHTLALEGPDIVCGLHVWHSCSRGPWVLCKIGSLFNSNMFTRAFNFLSWEFGLSSLRGWDKIDISFFKGMCRNNFICGQETSLRRKHADWSVGIDNLAIGTVMVSVRPHGIIQMYRSFQKYFSHKIYWVSLFSTAKLCWYAILYS